MRYPTAVVIGKFYPPHRGHHFLIETALSQADLVHVIVCGKRTDTIPGELRGQWLQQVHPSARVMVIDDQYDENDSRIWAENTVRWLGAAPDVVFTSEDYGDRYAEYLGCRHESVDKARRKVPCSGTMIRQDPFANWQHLERPTRGWFAKRVCVLGAESTGTTTLAADLATVLDTNWVAEYGREYSAIKQARGETSWHTDEFTVIATEQTRHEDEAACSANRVLVCDTNAFATTLWHRRYLGYDSSAVAEIAAAGRCDLYLLTGDEIPFVQDGLRDGEAIRHQMHDWFVAALANQTVPWCLLRGSRDERLSASVQAVRQLFGQSEWIPAFTSSNQPS